MRIKMRSIILIATFLGIPAISQAWDGVNTGVISAVQVTDGNINGFRVFLTNVSAYCSGANSGFAYLNAGDSNYQVYVAALLLAKSIGSTVTVYANNDSTGYCHIGYINVN
jgi:hypothetical protein